MTAIIYIEFFMQFFSIFAILIITLQLSALALKIKEYIIELLILGLISFCILMLFSEFSELTMISARLSEQEVPEISIIINKMFALMASILVFSIAIIKNKLKKIQLGFKK